MNASLRHLSYLRPPTDNGGPLAQSPNPAGLEGVSGANNYPLVRLGRGVLLFPHAWRVSLAQCAAPHTRSMLITPPFPLLFQRGGKMSNTEGGVRVNAFATGGIIPAAMRGTKSGAFVAIEDWYTTFCTLAGVDPTDARAAAAGLPPVDGLDLWPVLSGANATSGRRLQFLGSTDNTPDKGNTIVQGVIRAADGYKLLIGDANPSFWQVRPRRWSASVAVDTGL